MKTYEIYGPSESSQAHHQPVHVVEAEKINFKDGQYLFMSPEGRILHAIVAMPGMFIRTIESK
jgi:hypothetical protein